MSENNIIDIHTASLMKRLHSYFDEIDLNERHGNEDVDPMFKLRSLNLITEIYAYVNSFFTNRSKRLSEYFNECTLKQCLEWVVEVEDLQQNLYRYFQDLEIVDEFLDFDYSPVIDNYTCLYTNGVQNLCKDDKGRNMPSICNSLLWAACSYKDKESFLRFKRVFQKAREEFNEKNQGFEISSNPEDRGYNETIRKSQLSERIARKVMIQTHDTSKIKNDSDYNLVNYINLIYQEADKAEISDIRKDLIRALELLRNTFMTDAEDIYYIRTGDFDSLKNIYNEDTIEYFYTTLPFKEYYETRESFRIDLKEDLDVKLELWRSDKGYVYRKITDEEHLTFLEESKEDIESEMKKYESLWKLRMHSGGLDAEVTFDNFARMFYRRKGVDRYFIELQWRLELLQELITEQNEKTEDLSEKAEMTLDVKAVEMFVHNIIQLANATYKKWNNKRVSLGANKPEVHIVINRDDLIKFIQEKKRDCFDELKDLCYPENGKTKMNFCKYVSQLRKEISSDTGEEKYFGKLPNKELAKILAPIIGLREGTVTNYLSQT